MLELPILCGEGEQMMQVTQVFHHAMPVMQYESKHNPLMTTLDNAFVGIGNKC
jgi:hypothetical protein